MKGNPDAAYLKCGISFDVNIEAEAEYRRISNSLILGAGKSFVINDVLRVSIEPTLRCSLYDYGEIYNLISDRLESYRPVSAGQIIDLDQLQSGNRRRRDVAFHAIPISGSPGYPVP